MATDEWSSEFGPAACRDIVIQMHKIKRMKSRKKDCVLKTVRSKSHFKIYYTLVTVVFNKKWGKIEKIKLNHIFWCNADPSMSPLENLK